MAKRRSTQPILPFPADRDREAFANYVTGFVDGEGSYTLYYTHTGTRATPDALFSIGLRADDHAILRLIQSFFGCGVIYFAHSERQRGNDKPKVTFRINRLADLSRIIIPHFIRYPLLAKKGRDFLIWKQAVELMSAV